MTNDGTLRACLEPEVAVFIGGRLRCLLRLASRSIAIPWNLPRSSRVSYSGSNKRTPSSFPDTVGATSLSVLSVLPFLPTPCPTYQSYAYPNRGDGYLHSNVPRFALFTYPTSRQRSSNRPSVEDLEEREHQHALAVISS